MAKDYEQESLDKLLARTGSTEYVKARRAENRENDSPYAAYAGYVSCILRDAEYGFKRALERARKVERELLALQLALEYGGASIHNVDEAYEMADRYETELKNGVSIDDLRKPLDEEEVTA